LNYHIVSYHQNSIVVWREVPQACDKPAPEILTVHFWDA